MLLHEIWLHVLPLSGWPLAIFHGLDGIMYIPKRTLHQLRSVNTEGGGFASRNAAPMKLYGLEAATRLGRPWVCLLVCIFF